MWVVRVGGDDGELRPWHCTHVYSTESRLIMRFRYDSDIRCGRVVEPEDAVVVAACATLKTD